MKGSLLHPWSRQALAVAGLGGLTAAAVVAALPFVLGAIAPADGVEGWLRWYGALLAEPRWRQAGWQSLMVGTEAALLATALAAGTALLVQHRRLKGWRALPALLAALVLLPGSCVAVLALAVLSPASLTGYPLGVVLAHAALGFPFAFVAVQLAVRPLDAALLRSAATLGASPGMVLGRVLLPLAAPGVLAGALLAFAVSLGDVAVAVLLGAPGQPMLAPRVLGALREAPNLGVQAVAALLVLSCVLLAGAAVLLLRDRLRTVSPQRQVGY